MLTEEELRDISAWIEQSLRKSLKNFPTKLLFLIHERETLRNY
jgi:hypothetical protein